jgi:phosphinothricin acetyltransferase
MLETSILVRDCDLGDIPEITAIYRHAVLHGAGTFETEPPDAAEMAARLQRIKAGGYPYLVAREHGKVLGYAYAYTYRDRPAYRFTVEDSIYVHEASHGRGIGGELMRRLIAAATFSGFRQMVAVIGDSGNVGSIRLHEKAGFVPLGLLRSVGWKGDRWLDVVLMQRALGEGDDTPPLER